MKQYADRNRSPREFQVGEMVFLKLQPYSQSSVVNKPYPKLLYKFYGPYRVLEKFGSTTYRLELPEESSIHSVFHVSKLKPQVPNHTLVFTSLPNPVDISLKDVQPKEILDWKLVKKWEFSSCAGAD